MVRSGPLLHAPGLMAQYCTTGCGELRKDGCGAMTRDLAHRVIQAFWTVLTEEMTNVALAHCGG